IGRAGRVKGAGGPLGMRPRPDGWCRPWTVSHQKNLVGIALEKSPGAALPHEKKKTPSQLQSTPCAISGNSEAANEIKRLCALPEDVYIEIECLIGGIVVHYVDTSNPVLHLDELKAECRAKLAKLLHDGRLERCLTRAGFFAFLKTAFKNHVLSLLQKHVYCIK